MLHLIPTSIVLMTSLLLSPVLSTAVDESTRQGGVSAAVMPISSNITWRYTSASALHVNPLSEGINTNIGFDLAGWARSRYGPSATVYFTNFSDPYSWKVRYRSGGRWYRRGINMVRVAKWHGRITHGIRLNNWGAYLAQHNAYGWKGAHIFNL